jgi:hypothetical protein
MAVGWRTGICKWVSKTEKEYDDDTEDYRYRSGDDGFGHRPGCRGAGFQVILVDTDKQFVDRGVANIRKFLGKKVEKGKLTQDQLDGCCRV